MTSSVWSRWWPWAKGLLAVVIVGSVGWQFARLLRGPELWEHSWRLHLGWLVVAVLVYNLAFAFPAFFWSRLLRVYGARPTPAAAARAYFVSHLGKYVPGKAWALVVRAALIRSSGVSAGLAALTATYETLTLMASGALLAVVLLSALALEEADRWSAVGLLALAGIPILPGVFNRLVALVTRKWRTAGDPPLPRLRSTTLLSGLALTTCTWALMGLSLGATLQALRPDGLAWDFNTWARHTAYVALAYVAGFLTLPAPGGLGVRELILQRMLTPELSRHLPASEAAALAVIVVLLLRLTWTVAEVFAAGVAWFLPAPIGQRNPLAVQQPSTDAAPPLSTVPANDLGRHPAGE